MRQSDKNTIAFLDDRERIYVRAPGEVLVEPQSKGPHHRALTNRILLESNRDGIQVTAILAGVNTIRSVLLVFTFKLLVYETRRQIIPKYAHNDEDNRDEMKNGSFVLPDRKI